jgi:hypothetical protein
MMPRPQRASRFEQPMATKSAALGAGRHPHQPRVSTLLPHALLRTIYHQSTYPTYLLVPVLPEPSSLNTTPRPSPAACRSSQVCAAALPPRAVPLVPQPELTPTDRRHLGCLAHDDARAGDAPLVGPQGRATSIRGRSASTRHRPHGSS